ncbi:TolC family protein [Roseomonas sp. E05]|uniref:TolC family protein n=1 Tax=Roseomonas sp. E05 TaxID=3046310 RepID=UPI0024B88FE0|nr:TolC family protein [Roseomonas sp. E05]MDJ0387709.1 TolC family protein [Roseomonas sp. E05]
MSLRQLLCASAVLLSAAMPAAAQAPSSHWQTQVAAPNGGRAMAQAMTGRNEVPATRSPRDAGPTIGLAELADRANAAHPQVRQAEAGKDAARYSLRDAYLGFAPRANIVFDKGKERLNVIRSDNFLYQLGVNNFRNQGYTLEVVQPIFDPRLFAQLHGAYATLRRARDELTAARQRTLFDLMQSYLTTLAAYDGYQVARAEEETLARQMAEVQTRHRLGLASDGDADEVEARLRAAEAQRMAAAASLNENFASLERRAGIRVGPLAPLAARIPMALPNPASADAWVREARAHNVDLRALESATTEARAQAETQAAALLPRLDLRLTQDRSDNGGTIYGGGSTINDRTLLFRLTVPLFNPDGAGYPVFAARARYQASTYRLEDQRLEVEEKVRTAFEEVVANTRRDQALVRALGAQTRIVAGKRARYAAGTLPIKDVLDSERDLYQAQRNLLAARYNYLLNLMMLKRLAGDFAEADLLYIDSALDRHATPVRRLVGEGRDD